MSINATIHIGISMDDADGVQVLPKELAAFLRDRCDYVLDWDTVMKVLAVGIRWNECEQLADALEHQLTINNISDHEEDEELGLMNVQQFIKLLRKGAADGRHVEIWE